MKLLRGRAALAAALMGAAALAACDGSRNPFQPRPGPGTGGGGAAADSTRPTVEIVLPDTQTDNVAVGDSVFVRARVRDNGALATVQFDGYAVRGSEVLGTATRVDRFTTKTVDLRASGRVVQDTTLDRFLNATADVLPEEGIYIVVTAADTAGNTAADTFRVNLGGPRVTLSSTDDEAFAGTQLTLRLTGTDTRDLIQSLLLTGSGAMQFQVPIQLPAPVPSVDTTVVVPIPIAARGVVTLTATAVSGSNLVGTAPQLRVPFPDPHRVVVVAGHGPHPVRRVQAGQRVQHGRERPRVVRREVAGEGDHVRPRAHRQPCRAADEPERRPLPGVHVRQQGDAESFQVRVQPADVDARPRDLQPQRLQQRVRAHRPRRGRRRARPLHHRARFRHAPPQSKGQTKREEEMGSRSGIKSSPLRGGRRWAQCDAGRRSLNSPLSARNERGGAHPRGRSSMPVDVSWKGSPSPGAVCRGRGSGGGRGGGRA